MTDTVQIKSCVFFLVCVYGYCQYLTRSDIMGRKKIGKSQNKTLRLREQQKFAVNFWSQKLAQSGNAVIGQAVETWADDMSKKHRVNWRKVWHDEESVRELRKFLLTDDDFPFDDTQTALRRFVFLHREFFYTGETAEVNERNAIELYPMIDKWRAVAGDHWAPGRAMNVHLKKRGLPEVVWPPVDAE